MSNVHLACEIGQNHNSHLGVAHELIEAAANPYEPKQREHLDESWDSVKFCKRDLDRELTRSAANRPYEGRQSFDDTYLSHREALELSWDAYEDLYAHAKDLGLDVGITLCAETLVDEMPFRPDYLKVASRDLSHTPLIEAMAETGISMVISTGMYGKDVLDDAVERIVKYHGSLDDVTILHCLSEYPATPKHLNMRTIPWLQDQYVSARVGYSDHTVGMTMGAVAIGLGATWIEKHCTLYRGMRGSDHEGALDPDGMFRFVRDMREAERALGEHDIIVPPTVESARKKLERSVAAEKPIEPGTVVGSSNTVPLSADPDGNLGVRWREREDVFGAEASESIPSRTVVSSTMVEDWTRDNG